MLKRKRITVEATSDTIPSVSPDDITIKAVTTNRMLQNILTHWDT